MRLSRLLIAKNLDQVWFLTPALPLDFIPIIHHHGRLSSEVSIPYDIFLECSMSMIWCLFHIYWAGIRSFCKDDFPDLQLYGDISTARQIRGFLLDTWTHIVTSVILKNLVLLSKLHYWLEIQLHSYASETMELDLGSNVAIVRGLLASQT